VAPINSSLLKRNITLLRTTLVYNDKNIQSPSRRYNRVRLYWPNERMTHSRRSGSLATSLWKSKLNSVNYAKAHCKSYQQQPLSCLASLWPAAPFWYLGASLDEGSVPWQSLHYQKATHDQTFTAQPCEGSHGSATSCLFFYLHI
jgi:hypothetical protein